MMIRDHTHVKADILMFLNWRHTAGGIIYVHAWLIIRSCNINSTLFKKHSKELIEQGLIQKGNPPTSNYGLYSITQKGKKWLGVWEDLRAIEREGL